MTQEIMPPIGIAGIIICCIGFSIAIYDLMRDKNWSITIPSLLTCAGIGLFLILVVTVQSGIEGQENEKKNQAQIESMSCSQLHEGLLHNTINGTYADVQRATERYVAGCESK